MASKEDQGSARSVPRASPNGRTEAAPSAALTPGPWLAEVDYVHGPIVTATDGVIVADYTMWDGAMAEAKANARLIAAAPDLYEALRALRSVGGGPHHIDGSYRILLSGIDLERIDAALAKAGA